MHINKIYYTEKLKHWHTLNSKRFVDLNNYINLRDNFEIIDELIILNNLNASVK